MPSPAPLTGIRVLEIGSYIAGPFCGMQLADLGADVIKIEVPDSGDLVRHTAPYLFPNGSKDVLGAPSADGQSSNFIRLNRNKRSLALDLKDSQGKEIFRKLAATADVVVENLRPGTMKDLDLDYEQLERLNPMLVYVAASGWGQTGPYSQLAGLDIMAQAMSGVMSITGEPDGNPVKAGVPMCDLVCALYGALAAVSALRARVRDGHGQYIDVCLFEAGVSLSVWEAGRYFATGEVPGRLGSAHQSSAPYQAIRSSDGYFTIGATSPRNWASFCQVIGREEWIDDPQYKDNPSRHARLGTLIPAIEEVTSTRPMDHWIAALQESGVPCGKIQTYDKVFNDEHLLARGYFWDAPHKTLPEPVRQLGSPMHFSETPVEQREAGPVLGEDSRDVLSELGFSEAEIASLAERKVTVVA